MSQIVPSYMLKIARAEKHLVDLRREVDRYSDREPYTVDSRHYRKRHEHRLAFTEDPINTHIGVILADLIHNLTSGLDHLLADMVPPKDRSRVMFPVLWQGVWENGVPGENSQRAKDRARWKSITRNMNADAATLLQKMQPPVEIPENTGPGPSRYSSALQYIPISTPISRSFPHRCGTSKSVGPIGKVSGTADVTCEPSTA
jgi:hypothetical protein